MLVTAAGGFDLEAIMILAHAAILAERTAALMIDSTVRMAAELAAIDARALAMRMWL